MRNAAALVLVLSCLAGLGCDQGRERERSVAFTFEGASPTAVNEVAAVRVRAWGEDGSSVSPYDYTITSASCALPGCTATLTSNLGSGTAVAVGTTLPGDARVTIVVDAEPPATIEVTIPFRTPTRIAMDRAVLDSPAGSAHAMVPKDTAQWFVSAGDDKGTLAVNPRNLVVTETSDEIRCRPDDSTDDARRYGADRLLCYITPKAPAKLELSVRYIDVVRKETIVVADFASVREATLVVCNETRLRAGDRQNSYTVPVLLPVEAESLPCEPVTIVRYPGFGCEARSLQKIVPRLVLDDGRIALGGGSFLKTDDEVKNGYSGTGDIDYRLEGQGTIVGTFGSTSLSIPYEVGSPCIGGR